MKIKIEIPGEGIIHEEDNIAEIKIEDNWREPEDYEDDAPVTKFIDFIGTDGYWRNGFETDNSFKITIERKMDER